MTEHRWTQWVIRIFCAVALVAGSLLVVGGLPGKPMKTWPGSFVSAGAGMIAASLAALVGLQAAVGWREQRRREMETSEHKHREEVYEILLRHMTESFVKDFTSGGPTQPEALVRSQVAVWGSPETIRALRQWHRETHEIVTRHGGVISRPEVRAALWDAYYDVVRAVRNELSPSFKPDSAHKDLVLGMVFNDYPQAAQKTGS